MKITENNLYSKKALSVSFSSNVKKTSIKHNERKKDDVRNLKNYGSHINANLTDENLILVSTPIREAYENLFGDAVKTYNDRQKRKDRKISDYYSKVFHDKSLDTQKEFIVQLGSKADVLSDNPEKNRELHKAILTEYLKEFKTEYPQLVPYSAVVHVDEEGGPHLHLCVIPVARGYQRGMSKRPSFSKATGVKTVQQFKDFCENNRGLVLKSANKVLGTTIERKKVGSHSYLEPEQYRELMHQANFERQKASEVLADAEDQKQEILDSANEQAKKILSSAQREVKTKQAVDAEVKQYYADQMTVVNNQIEAKKTKVNEFEAKKTELDKEIRLKRKTVNDLTDQKTNLTSDLAELRPTLESARALQQNLTARETAVSSREEKVNQKEQEQAQKDREQDAREKNLDERETALNALYAQIKADMRTFWIKSKKYAKKHWEGFLNRFESEPKTNEDTAKMIEELHQWNLDIKGEDKDQQL